MPSKDLLETYPLYKRLELDLPVQRHLWPRPAIVAHCPSCCSQQTYNAISDYAQYDEKDVTPGAGGAYPPYSSCLKVVYRCAGCHQSKRYFLVLVVQQPRPSTGRMTTPVAKTAAIVQKVGQYPPWDIAPDPRLATRLGARVSVYKKGLICESQGFGIGAFAYYRRIVEEAIDELLSDIATIVTPDAQAEYAHALAQAAASTRAADKIDHVKEVLPSALRPGGANPLLLIHGALSEGLHGLSDEDCLERAAVIRGALVFLVTQIRQAKDSAEQFHKDLQTMVDRRSKGRRDPAAPTEGQ